MDKDNVLNVVMNKLNHQNIQEDDLRDEELIREVEYTLLEIETARNIFDMVDDYNLIDVAIYSEEIAKRRLAYLISIAKSRGIAVTEQYIVDKYLQVAE